MKGEKQAISWTEFWADEGKRSMSKEVERADMGQIGADLYQKWRMSDGRIVMEHSGNGGGALTVLAGDHHE